MSSRPRSSIALASYNGERFINEQLESIVRQTKLPDELIIYDDASVDATPDIALDFADQAPFPVRFFRNKERVGSSQTFEKAIRQCTGDIIFLCDQDDVWYPNKIALIQERFITRPDAGAIFTNADVVDENLNPLGHHLWKLFKFNPREQAQVQSSDAIGVFFKHPVVTGATMAFRSCYRDLVLPIPDIWHDAWISLLIGATSSLDILPLPLIAYRQHDTNQFGIPFRGRNRGKTCAEIYRPQVQRYEAAQERLQQWMSCFPVSENSLHRLDEMLSFSRARAALPHARLFRLAPALHQLVALRYHKYAYGLYSFCKDLIR